MLQFTLCTGWDSSCSGSEWWYLWRSPQSRFLQGWFSTECFTQFNIKNPYCCGSVIDHRLCKNVVRTKKWQTRHSHDCPWYSYHILMSSEIYYYTDPEETGNVFVLSNKKSKLLLIVMSHPCLSSNRSKVWANQNACITQVIILTLYTSTSSYRSLYIP